MKRGFLEQKRFPFVSKITELFCSSCTLSFSSTSRALQTPRESADQSWSCVPTPPPTSCSQGPCFSEIFSRYVDITWKSKLKYMQYLKQAKHSAQDTGLLETAAVQGDLKLHLTGVRSPKEHLQLLDAAVRGIALRKLTFLFKLPMQLQLPRAFSTARSCKTLLCSTSRFFTWLMKVNQW